MELRKIKCQTEKEVKVCVKCAHNIPVYRNLQSKKVVSVKISVSVVYLKTFSFKVVFFFVNMLVCAFVR